MAVRHTTGTALHGDTPPKTQGESLAPTQSPVTPTHRQSVGDMISDQLHRLTMKPTPPDFPKSAEIDFPGRFLHFQAAGVSAQVRAMVTNAIRWTDDLRRCLPPGGDRAPPLDPIALLMAGSTHAYRQEQAKVALTVHLRTEKRRLELELAEAAEEYLREIGFSDTDLCDLTRRIRMLTLQEGGHDANGNSIISSRTGGTSLYCSSRLYRELGTKDDKVVDKEATVQSSKVDRDLHAARPSDRQAGSNPFLPVLRTFGLAGTTGGSTPDGSPPPSPPPSPKGSRPASPPPGSDGTQRTAAELRWPVETGHQQGARCAGDPEALAPGCVSMTDHTATRAPSSHARREAERAPMDTDDDMTETSQPAFPTRMVPPSNRTPQLPPQATAAGLASVDIAFKGKTARAQLSFTDYTVANLFQWVQMENKYSPRPERALTLEMDGKMWQMGQEVNSITTLDAVGFHLPHHSIRVKERKKWFAVGASVWFVGITADKPATVVTVRHSSPRYTIRFHHQTSTSYAGQSALRHPVSATSTISVLVDIGNAYTMSVSLDETTSDEFIVLMGTALRAKLSDGHPGVQSFRCRCQSHRYGDSGGSLFLSELGLRPDGQVVVTLVPYTPQALPPRIATRTPPYEVTPNLSVDHPAAEVVDVPSSGAVGCDDTPPLEVAAGTSPDPVITEIPPVMLRHNYNNVNWTVDADQLSQYYQAIASGPYKQMYPGQDNLADYDRVQVPRDKSWIAFFYHLPEFHAEGTTVAARRIVLYNSFCRFLAWTSPSVAPPPLGDKTLGMLFSDILLLQHHYVDAAATNERFQTARLCDRWFTHAKYRSALKPKFDQLKKDPTSNTRLVQWFGTLVLLFSKFTTPEVLPDPSHGLLYHALVYSSPPWTTASHPPLVTEPAAEVTERTAVELRCPVETGHQQGARRAEDPEALAPGCVSMTDHAAARAPSSHRGDTSGGTQLLFVLFPSTVKTSMMVSYPTLTVAGLITIIRGKILTDEHWKKSAQPDAAAPQDLRGLMFAGKWLPPGGPEGEKFLMEVGMQVECTVIAHMQPRLVSPGLDEGSQPMYVKFPCQVRMTMHVTFTTLTVEELITIISGNILHDARWMELAQRDAAVSQGFRGLSLQPVVPTQWPRWIAVP